MLYIFFFLLTIKYILLAIRFDKVSLEIHVNYFKSHHFIQSTAVKYSKRKLKITLVKNCCNLFSNFLEACKHLIFTELIFSEINKLSFEQCYLGNW